MAKKAEVVRRGYTKIAEKYHKQRDTYKNSALLGRLLKHFSNSSRILDLGCGAGVPVAKFLTDKGRKVTGIDFAIGMVKLAKKNVSRAKFMRMDMTKLRFKPNSFDGAVSFYAIIHVPREKHVRIYKQLHRIVKPGGVIFLNAGGADAWESHVKDYMGVPMFWSFYGPKRTLGIIKDAGFEIKWSKVLKLGGERQFWVLAVNKK